ncbi:ATP-binding protein [Corynebacterium poyangense]|uniref:ATP-binding protein n=1 Tax=Corynebacterium poyangense TaxID=2684405 RepID=UPI001CCFCF72|nr:ATP-binding protein [Corynebacterium poyangense]
MDLGAGVLPDIAIPADSGLSLIHSYRESQSTTLSLVLAGRMRCYDGTVHLWQPEHVTAPRQRAQHIALAGVPEIDSLERVVKVKTAVREQLAWATSWWRPTPAVEDSHYPEIMRLLEVDIDLNQQIGSLRTRDRFLLRITLALLARPDARLLIVDDIDQVKSMTVRDEVLERLRNLSTRVPIIVNSSNPDYAGITDRTIWVSPNTTGTPQEEK